MGEFLIGLFVVAVVGTLIAVAATSVGAGGRYPAVRLPDW